MSIIQDVLKEEIERLEKNISSYHNMLLSLPKGSIFVKQIGNICYAYRKYRDKDKIVSIYLGNIESEEVKKQIELNSEYRRIKSNILIAESELKKLKKAYKAYGK